MISLRFDILADLAGGELLTPALADRQFVGVSTDSRSVRPGELFVAIRGERYDGHAYVSQAVSRGAAGVVAARAQVAHLALPAGVAVIGVTDTHAAMIRLARAYLESTPALRLGVTGSNGKTTTKEFLYCLLKTVEPGVYRSPGNFNNLFGIPLAVFAMPQETMVAVLEMGISTPGEMARLAEIVRPHSVTVTNVSATHLEFLGTIEAVAREKLSLLRYSAADAPLVVNADCPVLMRAAAELRSNLTTFGINSAASFTAEAVTSDAAGRMLVRIEGREFRLPIFGQYQVYNLLAAYATLRAQGYDLTGVETSTIEFVTAPMRGEILTVRGVTLVVDCYNANPESVTNGLKSFAAYPHVGRRIVILGDMLELGKDAEAYHRQIGEALPGTGPDVAVLVGRLMKTAAEAAAEAGMPADRIVHFASAADCAAAVLRLIEPGDIVYLKGSRGIGLEAVLAAWRRAEENT